MLDRSSRSMKLHKLLPGTRYLICVLALGNWASHRRETSESHLAARVLLDTNNSMEVYSDAMLPLLADSPTSKCSEVVTLSMPDSMHIGVGIPEHGIGGPPSILTRRLGLIIGCCMGFIVFIVLVSILGYLKIKKQRQAIKRDQPGVPPEYISYRHFSIQSGEAGAHHSTTGGHPHFITNMNTTTIN